MFLRTSQLPVIALLIFAFPGLCSAAPATKERRYVIASEINLREQPKKEARIIGLLPIATHVEIHDGVDHDGSSPPKGDVVWSKVQVLSGKDKGKIGWVSTEYLVSWAPTVKRVLELFDEAKNCTTDAECRAADENRRMWAERAIAFNPRDKKARRHVSSAIPLPLAEAIRSGDLERVKKLVRAGEDLNEDLVPPGTEGDSGVTPLLAALFHDKFDIAKYLLEQGANPNVMAALGMGEDRYTPLTIAVNKGDKDLVALLIAKGANLNTCTSTAGGNNGTPLIRAISKQHHEIVQLLVAKGADVNAPGCVYGGYASTTLCAAAAYPDMVKLLLSRKADVNKKGEDGITPLICAIHVWKIESVKLLLKAGADPNLADSQGMTALMSVMGPSPYNTNRDSKQKKRMGKKKQDGTKSEPREPYIFSEESLSVLKLLVAHGARIDLKDKNGRTFEMIAVERGITSVPSFLMVGPR